MGQHSTEGEDQCHQHNFQLLYLTKAGGLGNMKIPILADLTKNISCDYGVLLNDAGIALRGLFLIDTKGVVRHITINDLPVGRSVDEVLRVIKAFQHVEKHGEGKVFYISFRLKLALCARSLSSQLAARKTDNQPKEGE